MKIMLGSIRNIETEHSIYKREGELMRAWPKVYKKDLFGVQILFRIKEKLLP